MTSLGYNESTQNILVVKLPSLHFDCMRYLVILFWVLCVVIISSISTGTSYHTIIRSLCHVGITLVQCQIRLIDTLAIHPGYPYDIMDVHYNDVIKGAMVSQIASLTIVYSTVYSGVDQQKHQSSASLAFVWGIHRWPVNSPHKRPVTRKMFPFDDVIMC